jgi:hypothetical protein
MFESEATRFQSAGIQIGADSSYVEEQLLSESLSPFSIGLRNNALEMARLYSVLFCFENEIRSYIRGTLNENEGVDWWTKLPPKIRSHAEFTWIRRFRDACWDNHREVDVFQQCCPVPALVEAKDG